MRETLEETGLHIEVTGLVGIYSNGMLSRTQTAMSASSSRSASVAVLLAARFRPVRNPSASTGSAKPKSANLRFIRRCGAGSTAALQGSRSPTSAEPRFAAACGPRRPATLVATVARMR